MKPASLFLVKASKRLRFSLYETAIVHRIANQSFIPPKRLQHPTFALTLREHPILWQARISH
ncbi:hypothetical protein CY652_20765 [Burkholderia sp. WAC0059]|nr:hypothetical protein CY652_20765 [Burkholderia sp. WAC0059]